MEDFSKPKKVENDIGAIHTTDRGLVITNVIDFKTWSDYGKYLTTLNFAMPWLIGDWIIYGEGRFKDKYSQALEATKLSYATLRNYKYVAGRFSLDRRRMALTYSHHAEVASKPPEEADRWLAMAEAENLSVTDLRYLINGGTVDGTYGGEPTIVVPPDPLDLVKAAYLKLGYLDRSAFLAWARAEEATSD